jgi:hypothetical protein
MNYYSSAFKTCPSGLPYNRIAPCYPFQRTGLDYCQVRFDRKEKEDKEGCVEEFEKVIIICLFTCMVTRAIHLEHAEDNSAAEFARVLRTFMLRRAIPEIILCDNGKNFEAISNCLHQDEKATEKMRQIHWQFLPRHAPHWGGFYERMNGSIKACLAKEFPRLADKRYIEIAGALAAISYRLNCRPLWIVSMDRDDPEMLCPNHFLIVGPTGNFGQSSLDTIEGLRKYHKAYLAQVDNLWHKMFNGYISALRVHHKWDQVNKQPSLKVGDYVLVPQHKIIKSRWPIARITKLNHDSTYGGVKSAKIEVYIHDQINVKKRNELFKKKKTADLTDDERKQVTGFFRPCKKVVLLEKLFPYEIWEGDARFDAPIASESVPLNFPEYPEVDDTDITQPMHELEEKLIRKEQKKNERRELARQKRPRDAVMRDEAKRPRRANVDYQRDFRDLIDGGIR